MARLHWGSLLIGVGLTLAFHLFMRRKAAA